MTRKPTNANHWPTELCFTPSQSGVPICDGSALKSTSPGQGTGHLRPRSVAAATPEPRPATTDRPDSARGTAPANIELVKACVATQRSRTFETSPNGESNAR